MDDNFFYRDLAGKRHLRSYLKAAILIAIFMGLVVVYALWQRAQMMAVVNAPARPVVWEPTPTSIPPTATPTATPEPCPTNPSDWTFSYPYPGYDGNLHKIGPACVYEGLERTAAWVLLASSMGYSGNEAAEALGFAEMPFKPVYKMKIMTDFSKGPMEATVAWPALSFIPEVHFWRIRPDGRPAVIYTLRGCYRTRSIVGNQVEEWGDYPVMCVLSGDTEGEWFVGEWGSKRFAAHSDYGGWRGFDQFGYAGNGAWVYLGHKKTTYPLAGLSDISEDRTFLAAAHGVAVWDEDWVEQTYGITMRELPLDWQSLGIDDQKSMMDSFVASLDKILKK